MLNRPIERAACFFAGGFAMLALGLGALAGPGDFAPGDDLIGSLPIMYPDGSGKGVSSGPQDFGGELDATMDVTLTLEGSMAEVETAVLDAYGAGWVEVEETDTPGEFAYVFHGNVIVDLDRSMVERGAVDAGLRPGMHFMGGWAQVGWSGNTVGAFVLSNPEIDLPIAKVLGNGTADAGSIDLNLLSREQSQAGFGLVAYGSVVQLELVSY